MAVEDGPPNPFDLDFYAATTDVGPNADLSSVENREWLYQRSYTVIELQHHREPVDLVASSGSGLVHLSIDTPDVPALSLQLAAAGVKTLDREGELRFSSPDGHGFVARQSART